MSNNTLVIISSLPSPFLPSPQFNKSAALSVNVPKNFGRSDATYAPVDLVPKRRSASSCQSTLADFDLRDRAYRPPNRPAFSSDAEKERLAEVFTFKGGSALPAELTNMVGPMPSEVKRMQAERDRVEKAKAARRARLNGGVDPMAKAEKGEDGEEGRDPKDLLFEQIYDEIMERRAFQAQMEDTKEGGQTRRQVAGEISQRISKLKQLNPGRAAEVIQELVSYVAKTKTEGKRSLSSTNDCFASFLSFAVLINHGHSRL